MEILKKVFWDTIFRIFFSLLLVFPICDAWAFDSPLEGRFRVGTRYIPDSPDFHKDFDSAAELRLGVLGEVGRLRQWKFDYEISGDARWSEGASEQSGLVDESDVDFFRAWLRMDNGQIKIRGGRQQILFGPGFIFRPLGFFDTRNVTGILPETIGVDGVRATYFFDDNNKLEGWLVPAKEDARVIAGLRWEGLLAGLELGGVAQYHPETELDDFRQYTQELVQLGYHLQGEYEVGFWTEGRLDIERINGIHPLRFDMVLGTDYTFDIGEGLHVLFEYFLTTRDENFTPVDLSGDLTIHQFGLLLDQPVGLDIKWQVFSLYDVRDGTFQIIPQIEYYAGYDTYIYLQGRWGGTAKTDRKTGRLFRETTEMNGTESNVGLTLVAYF